MKRVFAVEYAGHEVRYSFLYRGTMLNFRNYIRPVTGEEFDIRVTPELMETGRKLLPEYRDDYVEYRLLIELTSRFLLKWGCCIFHSAAFVCGGKAWLLAAPSGVGKTTQFLNWQRLHPGETRMITGDMPVIEPREDGAVMIHSSPWCGKENFGNRDLRAPLGGVVLLEQGGENRLGPLEPRDAIIPFFNQAIVMPETEEEIRALAKVMDRMMRAGRLAKFINNGDDASTEMLRAFIIGNNEGGANG